MHTHKRSLNLSIYEKHFLKPSTAVGSSRLLLLSAAHFLHNRMWSPRTVYIRNQLSREHALLHCTFRLLLNGC
ncbi:hypothetical protein FKM82_019270 [Ascaphus truei]